MTRSSPIGKSSPTLDTAGWRIDRDSMVQEVANSAAWDFSRSSSRARGTRNRPSRIFIFLRLHSPFAISRGQQTAHSTPNFPSNSPRARGSALATTWHRLDLFRTSAHVVVRHPIASRAQARRHAPGHARDSAAHSRDRDRVSLVARRASGSATARVERRAAREGLAGVFSAVARDVAGVTRGRHGVQLPRGRARAAG